MYTYEAPEYRRRTSKWAGLRSLGNPLRLGRDFCLETSMHGFRHIAEPRRHWMERLLWLTATCLAAWGALDVSLGQLQRYRESPTVVALEKDFRSWRYSLPAVTACSKNRVDPTKLVEAIKGYWSMAPSDQQFAYYSRFVHVVANSTLLQLGGYQEFSDDVSLDVDLFQLAVDVMPDLVIKCISSENVVFKWTPVMTEAGACYSTNSLAIEDVAIIKANPNDTAAFPIKCSYNAFSCYIMLEVVNSSDFYVHSPYDVADITSPPFLAVRGVNRVSDLSVIETECGKGVKGLAPARRACLFTDEPTEKGRRVYSTNSCRLACRNKVALKLCGCKPFYYFYDAGLPCTPSGMACLSQHAALLASMGGLQCPCSAQCLYSVFRELSYTEQVWDRGPFAQTGSIRFAVQAPRTRYTREIVFHFQDLVVSFGGAAGLFLGASFISFVEILYFIIERLFKAVTVPDDDLVTLKKKTSSFETDRMVELTAVLEQHQIEEPRR